MSFGRFLTALLGMLLLIAPVFAQTDLSDGWLSTEEILAGAKGSQQAADSDEAEPSLWSGKRSPLPFHTIEGVGGGLITPMAYLTNPGPEGTVVARPSISVTYLQAGSKSFQTFAVSETFYRRIEIGYALSHFYMGSLADVIRRDLGVDIRRNGVYLHNVNARVMVIEEDSFGLPLPAVTVGAHYKHNDGIPRINSDLSGALGAIGFAHRDSVDFVVTASKTIPEALFGRPLMGSVGVRGSRASQLGYLGFSGEWTATMEANVACWLADWLVVAYEFRQKANPYGRIDGIIGEENNWHAVYLGWKADEHLTVTAGWVYLGTLANSDNSNGVALQIKYDF